MSGKPIVALVYDFDKTLATDDMQNFSFIPKLGMEPKEFWGLTTEFSDNVNMEKILSYMYMMIKMSKEKGIKLTREYLRSLGKDVKYYDGVTTWFKRINAYGESVGVKIEHYIVSSGTKEIIEGTSIAKEFKEIYGCEFLYENGEATWPLIAINYTAKTQFIFRIAKGALNPSDDVAVNQKSEFKRIPYRNFVYLGDGLTDIPCMKLVKEKGGKSIAVYPKGKKEKVLGLFNEERVNYICKADYEKGSDLEKVMKLIIDQVSLNAKLSSKEAELSRK